MGPRSRGGAPDAGGYRRAVLVTRLSTTRISPELNPVEKVWSTMKGSLANLAVHTATGLPTAVKNRLKSMQYRTRLIDGYLTGTGLSPPSPTRP
jgi:hypothetical protein